MFNDVKMLDWGKGTSPIYGGRKVDVVAVDGNKRQISWKVPGEAEPTKRWVGLEELTEQPGVKIPPKTVDEFFGQPLAEPKQTSSLAKDAAALAAEDAAMEAGAPPAAIATKEIDLATQRDQLAAQIEDLQNQLAAQTESYDGKLKAQLDISTTVLRDLEEERRRHARAVSALEGRKKDYDWLNGLFEQQGAELEAARREVVLANQRVEEEKSRRQKAQSEKLAETAKLTSAVLRIADLRDMLHLQTQQGPDQSDYDYLEHLIMETGAELAQKIDSLTPSELKTNRTKRAIETQTCNDIDDGALEELINSGWRVVFETAYVLPAYNDRVVLHMVRLERETQEPTYTRSQRPAQRQMCQCQSQPQKKPQSRKIPM